MKNVTDFYNVWQECLSDVHTISYKKLKEVSSECGIRCGELLNEIKSLTRRRLICFYGNCQITTMARLAKSSAKLMREYMIFSFGPVQDIHGAEEQDGFDAGILSCIDIFIYQNVFGKTKIARGLTTDQMVGALKEGAAHVSVPNIYFRGYFPQAGSNRYNVVVQGKTNQNGMFPWGDKNIERLAADYSAEEIAEILSSPDFYSPDFCRKNAEDSLAELSQREGLCDIKISDYIQNNYKEEQLFFGVNHPQWFVVGELMKRVFAKLGMSEYSDMKTRNQGENDGRECLIYPSVALGLGLKFQKTKFNWYKDVCPEPTDMLGYVSAYLHWCGRKIIFDRVSNRGQRVMKYKYDLLLSIHRADFNRISLPEKFIIYGAGNLGKVFFDKLIKKENVICFIDKFSKETEYAGVPIYTPQNAEKVLSSGGGHIVVSPAYEYKTIYAELHDMYPSADIVPLDDVL